MNVWFSKLPADRTVGHCAQSLDAGVRFPASGLATFPQLWQLKNNRHRHSNATHWQHDYMDFSDNM